MNYRHGYHAGNFADVHKHVALVCVLQRLAQKDKPFAAIDTHAGAGLYDLGSVEARRTKEANEGIERFRNYAAQSPSLGHYLEIARGMGVGHYPGSPLIIAKMLRSSDRLIAIEKHPEEFATLEKTLSPFSQARAVPGDGYELLQRHLPPPERRGLVVIDPPYENPHEFEHVAQTFAAAYSRFVTGVFLIWYPYKNGPAIDALTGEMLATGVRNLLRLTIDVGSDDPGHLSAAGLLVANPPFEFDRQMRDVSEEILPQLRRGPDARASVDWIAGPE